MSNYSNRNRVSSSSSSGGIGFTGLLQIAFIILKLCHVIDWSWWWVLAPTWISILLVVIIFACSFVYLYVKSRNGVDV